MTVNQLMTRDPACCTPDTTIQDVARMMLQHDCGEIPVVQRADGGRLVGVITDRDIVARSVSAGDDPSQATVARCMSTPVVSVKPDMDLEECLKLMEEHQIRRVPVVDADDCCCGIVSQADIAFRAGTRETGELVREVSRQH